MENICKKCLLLEAGEKAAYNNVKDYISTLDDSEKADDKIYVKRLALCKKCDCLLAGMCLKCGCYVEIRCAILHKTCPNADNRMW